MFGGISTSICTWSGHISASTILTPFLLHSMLKIFAMSWRNAPYATFLRNFGANTIWYLQFHLSQFTRNYTQTTKQGLLTTNKGWVSRTGKVRDIQPVLLSGVSKGYPFGTRLCLQSVVCYTLCRRCCENAVATREGKGIWNGRKTGLWLRGVEPQAQDWFHQQTGRIWKPRPSSYAGLWDKVSQSDSHTHEKADGFSFQNWNGREAILGLFRLDYPLAKSGRTVNGGAFMRRSSWPLTGSAGFAISSINL